MDAVERNDAEMVNLLLENGANVTTPCGDRISRQGKSKLCSLSSLYRQDFLFTVYCKEDSCRCGNTAVHVSAKYGLWNIAEKLTSKQVFDLTNANNCQGESVLMVAISHGHTHFIYKINETLFEKYGRLLSNFVIVQKAILWCSDGAVKHILEYPIHYIYEHRWEFLLQIIRWRPYVQFRSGIISPDICSEAYEDGDISLGEWIKSVSRKRVAIIKLLVESYKEKSFILSKKDGEGKTLLHHAVEYVFDDAVKYLHQTGADTRIKDRNGNSALTLALSKVASLSLDRDALYRCYVTSDGQFISCNTTNHDEILRYLIWLERSHFSKCDDDSASLLKTFIEKDLPLSLYELLKGGVDMNCKGNVSVFRPFLNNLRLGGRQLTQVILMFEVDILLQCGAAFNSSELHLISYLALPDNMGNCFKSASRSHSLLQSLIDKHPNGVSILDKCYDAEGYLPIHRAAQGGNLDAIKWFKSVGVNTQLQTKRGLSALDLSILYLGDISQARLIASTKSTPYSLEKSNYEVPVTISDYRKGAFEELLRTFVSATPEYRSEFPCGANAKGISPLHIAAVKGMSVLRYVYTKVAKIFPNLLLNCTNKHGLDPVYVAHFYESVLNEGLVNKYSKHSDSTFEETKTLKEVDPKPNNKIKNRPESYRNLVSGKDIHNDISIRFPDREIEYYMVFNYLYFPPPFEYTDEDLHKSVAADIRVNACPDYYDKIASNEVYTTRVYLINPNAVNFTECSKVQVRRCLYVRLCKDEILKNLHRKSQDCSALLGKLKKWFMYHPRRNRQISPFLAERLDCKEDVSKERGSKKLWPFSFLHDMLLKKHKSWKYLMVLNEALEVADVRFYGKRFRLRHL